jgi:hypothetical protein
MIAIYKAIDPDSKVDSINRLFSPHDGTYGSFFTQKLYVRNSDESKIYTNIRLQIVLNNGDIYNVSENNNVYQLFPGDIEPTAAEWQIIPHCNIISLQDIYNNSSYVPFFLRVYSPGGQNTSSRLSDAVIRIEALEDTP